MHCRHGFNRSESLLAVVLLTCGLLFLAIGLPVLRNRTPVVSSFDELENFGRDRLRDFRVRGYLQRENWLYADPQSPGQPVVDANGHWLKPNGEPLAEPIGFCIDPLYWATHDEPAAFPSDTAMAAMPRITLRRTAGAGPMSIELADHVFTSQANLAITQHGSSSSDHRLPQQFAWLVTIVPIPTTSDRFAASVIIYPKDNRNTPVVAASAQKTFSLKFLGDGRGGGPAVLLADTADALLLFPGQWLLVARTRGTPQFRWYRVDTIDSEVRQGDTFRRQITLSGPNWFDVNAPLEATLLEDVAVVYGEEVVLNVGSSIAGANP